jgi:M3 family oligoendopeptidase
MTTTKYLPDLSHLSRTPRWLPADLPEQLDAAWIRARYDEVLAACDAAGEDPDAWADVVLRTSELEALLDSHGSRAGIAYRQQTDDEAATAAYERWNQEVSPTITDASIEVARKVVASPCADAIAERFGELYLRQLEGACRAHAPVNTALRTELSGVLMRHTRIFGKGTFTWRGETHPLSFGAKAALDPDRDERHAAWRSRIDYVRANEDELQAIFDEARELRSRMAANLDQPSYVDLRYLEMRRFDWTPEDAARVRAAIEQHVVPIATELQLAQARALGTERLHPADSAIMPEPPPALQVEIEGELDAASTAFDSMGEAFGGPWRTLVGEGLVDLPARPGKGTGAFCSGFAFERIPFIFCNSVGAHDDVKTLVHEYGHALQGWRSREIEPLDLQHPTMEACEIHSMTLELLAMPYLGAFFGDQLDHYRVEHLRSTLDVVPYMAAIDEFQHRIYQEGLDAAGRAAAWEDAARRFQPAIDWDVDEWYAGGRWLLQLHVFQYPFYYLDYALARIVSWQLWLRSLEDEQAAIDTYLRLCDIGGTRTFRQMVTDAGLGDPFDPEVIERTMRDLRPHLQLVTG